MCFGIKESMVSIQMKYGFQLSCWWANFDQYSVVIQSETKFIISENFTRSSNRGFNSSKTL